MQASRQKVLAATILLAVVSLGPATRAELRVRHEYNLSDFTGTIPYNYASLHVDREFDEIYVTYQNVTRIFNASGMEIFSFGDPDPGVVTVDLTVVDGEIYSLIRRYRRDEGQAQYAIEHRNYRGELRAIHEVVGLPADGPTLGADRIFQHDGELLIVDKANKRVVKTDLTGRVVRVLDLAKLLGVPDEKQQTSQIFGFSVDTDGTMLLTVPVLFRAYLISPDGDVRAFGKGGSVPGSFGVAAGIARDEAGRVYVADRQRSVVMVFDANLRFVTEFGYRGRKPENLIRPGDLAIGNNGTVYITQLLNRGVAVFKVTDSDSTEPGADQARERKEVREQANFDSAYFGSEAAERAARPGRIHATATTHAGPAPSSTTVS
jgi:hypothetical protein